MVFDRPGRGFGNVLEIKENSVTDFQWLEREHHSNWFLFRAPTTTLLTFDIIPTDPRDDIDFLLFAGNLPDICDKIRTKQAAPVRSNISRNDKSLNSVCGLSKEATDDFVRSGVGSSYSRAIEVKEGDLYYLLVDIQDRPNGGFTLHFHYGTPPPLEKPELPQRLEVRITDASNGKAVDAALTIEGMRFDSVVEAKGRSHYEFRMDNYRKLQINCLRKGYMFQTEKVPPSGEKEVVVDIKLQPIEPGAQVALHDIRFVGNDSKVMRTSEASLYLLLHFLEQNPSTKVEILGHVNGPKSRKFAKDYMELSGARARTVYEFLMVNDVDPERVSYRGLGNTEMLFPDPKNQMESQANRRVEVRVTGK